MSLQPNHPDVLELHLFRPEFALLRVSEFSFLGGPAAEIDSVKRWTLFLELGF